MESLRATMIFMALSSAVLATTFLYVWRYFIRRRYVLLWALGWVVAVPHVVLQIHILSAPSEVAAALSQLFLVTNALLMLAGCYHFVHRRMPPRAVCLLGLVLLLSAPLLPASVRVPASSLLLGASYLWASALFFRFFHKREILGSRVVAILFALAGLHELDYPLLSGYPEFATVGYTLAATLAIAISFCLLAMFLEESRHQADSERAQMRGILDHLPVGVLVANPEGGVMLANAAARTLLPTEVQSHDGDVATLEALLFGDPTDEGDRPITRALRGEETSVAREMTILTANGSTAPLLVNAGAVHDERGRLLGAVAVFDDIGELKQMQAEVARAERLKGLGTLAAGVAHDFNNALTMILGHAELAATSTADPALHAQLETICRVATDSVSIVKRIQDMARTRVTHDPIAFDVASVVREVVDLSRPRWRDEAQASGVHYKIETHLEENLTVGGQPSEIREALLNLVLNALDAMPEGGTIGLSVARQGDQVVLDVSDTGTGIPEETRDRVFDPFFSTKGQRGTGLGLSIVFGIIQRHAGQITVESSSGQGARFSIRLPITTQQTENAAPDHGVPHQPMSQLRILAVDDEPLVRQLLTTLLELSGHEVTAAAGGAEAIQLARERRFDVVLTDLGMPDINGWEVAEGLRQLHPETPVILVTGWGDNVTDEQAEAGGVASVLPKPFTKRQLLHSLECAVRATAAA